MSERQREVIERLFGQWNSGDRAIDEALVDSDAEVHSAVAGSTFRGYGGIKDWMAEIDDQFDSFRLSVAEMRDLPDGRVLTLGSVHLRGRASGVEFDQPIAWIFTFAGERVRDMRIFADHQSALDAAG